MKIKYSLEEIKRIRYPKVPLASFLFFDPVSVGLVWVIINFTRIKSIQITCLGFLAGLFSAWYFFQGDLILGAFLFMLAVTLDWTDGKMVRIIKKQGSAVGMFLDGSLDQFFLYLNIFALTFGQFRITNQSDFLLFGAGIVLLWFTIYLFGIKREAAEAFYIKEEQKSATRTDRYNFLGKIKEVKDYFERKRIIPIFTSLEAATLVLIIGPILNIIKECLIASLLLSLLMFVIYLVVNIIHLSRFSSNS